MAYKYLSSHETTNFARLSRLVVDVISDLLRAVLKAKLTPPGPTVILQSQRVQIYNNLEKHQQSVLYPDGKYGTHVSDLKKLDFSLLYRLVRNIQGIGIPPPLNGWGKTPDTIDMSLSANIERLRVQRNEAYGHLPTASLSDSDFNSRWRLIRQYVKEIEKDALRGDTYVKAVDALLTTNMDPEAEKYYIEELEKQQKADLEVKAILREVKGAVADVTTKQESMASEIGVIKAGQEVMATSISHVSSRQEAMETNISDVSTKQEAMATNISDVSSRQEAMATNISDVSTRQEAMATNISDVSTRQEAMATNISDVAIGQEAMATNINDIKTRQETTTRAIHTLKGDVAAIKDTMNATSANTGHTKDIHADLKPMIERAKARMKKEKEEKKFYRTKGFHDAKDKLLQNRVIVIKGNTGDGKTAIAVQLLHWLSQEQGARQPFQLNEIKKLDLLDPNSKLITFIDDIFGEKDVCQSDVQEWNKRISDLKTCFVDEQTQPNFLIITIRNEVFNSLDKRSLGTIFTKDNTIDLSSHAYNIAEEKKQLLDLYKPDHFLWTDEEKEQISYCAPNIGFPQCCQLFYNSKELQKERVKFFENPFEFLTEALSKLQECSALLYLFLSDGMIRVKDLDPNSQNVNKKLLKEAFEINLIDGENDSTKLTCKKKVQFVREHLKRLLGSYIVKEEAWHIGNGGELWYGDVYRFNHDSIYVAVAVLYGKSTPSGYIQNCPSVSLSYLTISESGTNRVVISSDHYKEMCERLLREFEHGHQSVSSLDVWNDPVFVKRFVWLLNDRKVDKRDVLRKTCLHGPEECALYLLDEGVELEEETVFDVVIKVREKVLRKLLQYEIAHTARYFNNANVLHTACEYQREEMVTLLCDNLPHLVHGLDGQGRTPLHEAAKREKCSVFQTVERCVLNSLHRVEDQQHKCETVDGRTVHRNCACAHNMAQLVDNNGKTVLHICCERRNWELCLFICQSYPGLTTAVDKNGRHCLHYIAGSWVVLGVDWFTEFESHVQQYLEFTGCKYDITSILDNNGQTVLHYSCFAGNRDVCLYLCRTYPSLTTAVTNDGRHCLHAIAESSNSKVDIFTECETHVKQYLETTGGTYDITTIRDTNGLTVLHTSCLSGNQELCLYLCRSYPALTTAIDRFGCHCLHHIAGSLKANEDLFTECETYVKQYLESTGRTYDITNIRDNNELTVLHHSCMTGNREMCIYLCQSYPALTAAEDKNGSHCLHHIAGSDKSDVDWFIECETHVKQYLESTGRTYDITTILNNDGQTVLHYSCSAGNREVCLYLCQSFPTLTTAKDNDGCHCLHYLAGSDKSDEDWFTKCATHVKQYLESTGRTYDITTILDNDGKSVLDMANETAKEVETERGNEALLEHLVKMFGK